MKKGLLFFGLLATLCYASCHSEKEHTEEHAKYLATSPVHMDTVITKDYVCQIRATQHIELRALEQGYLQKIYVDEGQFVKKGQIMFQIMPNLYQAEMSKSKAEAEFAEIEYRNTKMLADSNVVSPNELALAKAKLDKANAELSLAQVHLSFTEIRAPFDGYMNRLEVRLGSLVDDGDLLTTLSDNSEMWVYFNVPEAEYLDYKTNGQTNNNMKVSLKMANNDIFGHIGVVKTIEADFNNETGNIAFRATFPNPDRLLRHGETGTILVPVAVTNALLIPQKCTYEVLNKKFVFVINDQNVITPTEITVGIELPHLYEVTSGLKEGDKILLEGLRKVRAGDKVEFDYLDPKKVMSELDLYAE
ncbi:efflux RND transporter periplasmic adaptor subunit [soil metagenome]